ncbi:MAG: DUF4344 domain-containing metallopeptidase [Pseudomonadota bacterium]
MQIKHYFLILAALHATNAIAQDMSAKEALVDANIRSIFYHELGHAVISEMNVPIFGQEEDAADVMSVLLIDALYEEEAAQALAYDSAFGFINDPEGTEEIAYWSTHGPDEQRYYNHVCLFYGANPDERDDLAVELGLPQDRAEYCPEEFDQANSSWSLIFDEMEVAENAGKLVYEYEGSAPNGLLDRIMQQEVSDMNDTLSLPRDVGVVVLSCGEANAYYDPQKIEIQFCEEFIPHLETIWEKLQ